MLNFELSLFSQDEDFPLFIQYGHHDEQEVSLHTHNNFSELVIVLSGHAMHQVGDESFYVKKGDVFVINENTAHRYYDVDTFRLCNIMFRMRSLLTSQYDITHTSGFHALFIIEPYQVRTDHFHSRLFLSPDDFLSLKHRLDKMLMEYDSNHSGRKSMLMSDFLYIITTLSRLYEQTSHSDKGTPFALAETISYMEQHYTEPLTVDDLAQHSGYSKRHFNRLFKETYQATPIEYILSLRIEAACRLLQQPDNNISNTAIQCGFDNANYFCRIFKQRTGITPSQYKQIF